MFLTILLSVFLSFEADFKQVKHVAILKTEQVSTGHMVYRAPNYMKWQYLTPKAFVWEIDGKKSNVSAPIQRLLGLVMNTISGNYLRENDQFIVSKAGDVYVLRPKKKELLQFFKEIRLTLNPKTQIADEVLMTEQDGSTTRITFSNVKK